MLGNLDLKNVLVIDIETVPQFSEFGHLNDHWKDFWSHKMKYVIKEGVPVEETYERAGIYAEFGKIICISAGCFYNDSNEMKFRLKSYHGDDEKVLLQEFSEMLENNYNKEEHLICGHNAKEFDFPYIARRCLINGIPIPSILDNSGKKPWEVRLLDTMEMWKFGDYKSYTSLKLLAALFGITSPKDDIDGSQVGNIYWKEKNIERIKTYCQKDVVTVAQILLKFKGMTLLKEENVDYAN